MMRIKSFAKINLGIEVLRKRDDGFHEIRTLFQSIDLFDSLEIRLLARNEIVLSGDDTSIPWDSSNLIYRAAILLKKHHAINKGAEIRVIKRIPAGKGLGGGSSNAAMTLLALNEIWELDLAKKDLKDYGTHLGADVPFFFEGGLCLGEGKGDLVFPMEDLIPCSCVLALPPFSVSTSSAYEKVPHSLTSKGKDSKIIRFLDSRDLGFLENDLEETVFQTYPQIKIIKSLIKEQGSELTLMSGSGSAVFGLFRQRKMAQNALRSVSKKHAAVCVTTLQRTDYWKKIQTGV
jgi:4-diphosphocytidyl-2-C-methyl-D-erythritol kinase